MILGIDASNVRGGGTLNHLSRVVNGLNPRKHGFEAAVIWSVTSVLDTIEDKPWIRKFDEPMLRRTLLHRLFWQKIILPRRIKDSRCDMLFAPGSIYTGRFRPYVPMHQNSLPFNWAEIRRYGISKPALRLILLRIAQILTFRRATGVIFVSDNASQTVRKIVGPRLHRYKTIYHGIDPKFFYRAKPQNPLSRFSMARPMRLLYVSYIGAYKHQWNVVKAVAKLRKAGFPVSLQLLGPYVDKKAEKLFRTALKREDPSGIFTEHRTDVPFEKIHTLYRMADVFIFASSCEAFGQIVTEAMAAGLPVCCSDMSAMPELLRDAGQYFNPLDADSIAETVKNTLTDFKLRRKMSKRSQALAKNFSWQKCVDETYQFLRSVHREHRQ